MGRADGAASWSIATKRATCCRSSRSCAGPADAILGDDPANGAAASARATSRRYSRRSSASRRGAATCESRRRRAPARGLPAADLPYRCAAGRVRDGARLALRTDLGQAAVHAGADHRAERWRRVLVGASLGAALRGTASRGALPPGSASLGAPVYAHHDSRLGRDHERQRRLHRGLRSRRGGESREPWPSAAGTGGSPRRSARC